MPHKAAALEHPPHWKADSAVSQCEHCSAAFSLFRRKHHCRECGGIFCDGCSMARRRFIRGSQNLERVCQSCTNNAQHPPDLLVVPPGAPVADLQSETDDHGRKYVSGPDPAARNVPGCQLCTEDELQRQVEKRFGQTVQDEFFRVAVEAFRAGGDADKVDGRAFWAGGFGNYVTDTVSRQFHVGQPVKVMEEPPVLGKQYEMPVYVCV
jgi:hypothetical protein